MILFVASLICPIRSICDGRSNLLTVTDLTRSICLQEYRQAHMSNVLLGRAVR